mmetsp:Transcript_435/g.1136  ORF Transcript_435/g.1136 Transcript_435/m.1136 type:complete len:309 (+) Transcript_435:489-1415(+)
MTPSMLAASSPLPGVNSRRWYWRQSMMRSTIAQMGSRLPACMAARLRRMCEPQRAHEKASSRPGAGASSPSSASHQNGSIRRSGVLSRVTVCVAPREGGGRSSASARGRASACSAERTCGGASCSPSRTTATSSCTTRRRLPRRGRSCVNADAAASELSAHAIAPASRDSSAISSCSLSSSGSSTCRYGPMDGTMDPWMCSTSSSWYLDFSPGVMGGGGGSSPSASTRRLLPLPSSPSAPSTAPAVAMPGMRPGTDADALGERAASAAPLPTAGVATSAAASTCSLGNTAAAGVTAPEPVEPFQYVCS